MKLTKIKTIYKKEILDLLRDKKTLIMMVLVPLLLYPLIMVVALLVSSAVSSNMQANEYRIAIQEEEGVQYDKDVFVSILEDTKDELEYHMVVVESSEPEKQLVDEEIDAYIQVSMEGEKVVFDVRYLSSITNSSAASDMLGDKLKLYQEKREETMLKELNLDADRIMNSVKIDWTDRSNKEERLGSIMGMILPFLLITSILMGAVYPSIDTTAGEKERGTLETLLTLPVRNDELIMGKFLAVATISVVSALLNLLSMGIMAGFLYNVMSSTNAEAATLNLTGFIPAVLIVVLCVIAFALFISAITMCVTTFAKSFKEANNYVTPLLLVVMLTGYISFIPNIEFNEVMATIPVANVCLLITNLLLFKYELSLIFIVLITNVAYAVLAIWALSKIYDSEEILFGEGGVSLQIFTNRKELKKGGVPNFSDAMLVVTISFLMFIYIGTMVQTKSLIGGLLVNQCIIIGMPLLLTWYTKKDWKKTFSVKMPKIKEIFGAILLEVGTFVGMLVLSVGLTKIFPEDVQSINQSFDLLLGDVPFWGALLLIGLLPAICEETLFRGYLLSATKNKFKPVPAMLIVAVAFGIFHMSLSKFFTTGILGFVFCYVVYKTGSIFLTCLMHFMNNAISVILMYYSEELQEIVPVLFKETLLVSDVLILLGIAILCGNVGVALIQKKGNYNGRKE